MTQATATMEKSQTHTTMEKTQPTTTMEKSQLDYTVRTTRRLSIDLVSADYKSLTVGTTK